MFTFTGILKDGTAISGTTERPILAFVWVAHQKRWKELALYDGEELVGRVGKDGRRRILWYKDEIRVASTGPGRWGPGRIHALKWQVSAAQWWPVCQSIDRGRPYVLAEDPQKVDHPWTVVTCKQCLRTAFRDRAPR